MKKFLYTVAILTLAKKTIKIVTVINRFRNDDGPEANAVRESFNQLKDDFLGRKKPEPKPLDPESQQFEDEVNNMLRQLEFLAAREAYRASEAEDKK